MKKCHPAMDIPTFADSLGIGECTAYRWAKRGQLPVRNGGISAYVPGDVAARILRDWHISCTQTEAATFSGLSVSRINTMLKEGILDSIVILPGWKNRILINSLVASLYNRPKQFRWNSKSARAAALKRYKNQKRRNF